MSSRHPHHHGPTLPHPYSGPQAPALRILLVEDHADTAASTALILAMAGHEVRLAPDGNAALRAAQAHPPDVVLLDLGLPGMDGYEVAKRLGLRPAGVGRPWLVAVTGYGQEADRHRAAQAGIHVHLVKPVDPGQLLALLERFRAEVPWRASDQTQFSGSEVGCEHETREALGADRLNQTEEVGLGLHWVKPVDLAPL